MTLSGGDAPVTTIHEANDEPSGLDGQSLASPRSGLAAASAPEPTISLDAVLSADMSVAWDESVAIIESLCQAVQENIPRSIPAATEIFLTASGTVGVRSGAGTPEPIEAGRHLLDLLGKGTVPAPLRLFASQAVRGDQHASIVEFQQGLEYFAKPGGRERIIGVFERCSKVLTAMPFPSGGEARTSKTLDKTKATGQRSALWRRGREAALVCGAVVFMVLVGWAGYFSWQELSKAPVSAASVAEVQADAPSAPARRATRGAAASSAPTSRQTDPAARREANAPASGAVAPSLVEPETAGPPAPPVVPSDVDVAARPSAAAAVAPPSPLFVQGVPAEAVNVDRVYTPSDPGVVPATLVREQLLPPAMGVATGAAPLQLELLVSADGAVERARFLVPPRRMTDMMLLSNAKTWTFNPALKDGRPVRSRVVLSWLVAP